MESGRGGGPVSLRLLFVLLVIALAVAVRLNRREATSAERRCRAVAARAVNALAAFRSAECMHAAGSAGDGVRHNQGEKDASCDAGLARHGRFAWEVVCI